MTPRSVKEWLSLAYGSHQGCPSPEVFLTDSLNELSEAEKKRIEQHASGCPACRAERELARAFDAAADDAETRREDVDHVVSRLQSPVQGPREPAGKVVAGPRKWFLMKTPWGLAAAAVFIVAVFGMFTVWRNPAPPLPAPVDDAVMRGGRVEAIGPVGELDTMPRALEWKPVPGADSYRVQVLEVDDSILWRYTGRESAQELPLEVLDRMHAAVVYAWEVEAMDAEGATIALSDRLEFRVRPNAQ